MRLGLPARAAGMERKRWKVEMCGRVIQASGPLNLAIVDGLDIGIAGSRTCLGDLMPRQARSCSSSGRTIRPDSSRWTF